MPTPQIPTPSAASRKGTNYNPAFELAIDTDNDAPRPIGVAMSRPLSRCLSNLIHRLSLLSQDDLNMLDITLPSDLCALGRHLNRTLSPTNTE